MLEKLKNKIRGSELESRITLVKCGDDDIRVSEKIDFGLAFFMVHEVPNKERFFRQLIAILNEKGQILVVEPKLFHVSRKGFALTMSIARSVGFNVQPGPRLSFSWSAVLGRT